MTTLLKSQKLDNGMEVTMYTSDTPSLAGKIGVQLKDLDAKEIVFTLFCPTKEMAESKYFAAIKAQ